MMLVEVVVNGGVASRESSAIIAGPASVAACLFVEVNGKFELGEGSTR